MKMEGRADFKHTTHLRFEISFGVVLIFAFFFDWLTLGWRYAKDVREWIVGGYDRFHGTWVDNLQLEIRSVGFTE